MIEMCINEAERLMRQDPDALISFLLDPNADPSSVSFAAEIAGELNSPAVIRALMRLLSHDKAVVREGAILGLDKCNSSVEIQFAMTELAAFDPSYIIREMAEGWVPLPPEPPAADRS